MYVTWCIVARPWICITCLIVSICQRVCDVNVFVKSTCLCACVKVIVCVGAYASVHVCTYACMHMCVHVYWYLHAYRLHVYARDSVWYMRVIVCANVYIGTHVLRVCVCVYVIFHTQYTNIPASTRQGYERGLSLSHVMHAWMREITHINELCHTRRQARSEAIQDDPVVGVGRPTRGALRRPDLW